MRIRELTIENFRKFRQPVALSGFCDGLNLVCESNERGKSTMLEALRAALFERHGSKTDRVRSFRPFGDEVAPSIGLVFEVGGEEWALNKRFLLAPSITLEGPEGRFQSDAAEEKLQSLLGFVRAGPKGADHESRGALGLFWVEQGAWSLDAPGPAARKTIEDVLAGQVGAVTGGRRTSAVVQTIDKALAEFLTATGRPTRRLLEAQKALDVAQAALKAADDELGAFESVLERLEASRDELRNLERAIVDPTAKAREVELDQDIARARSAAQELQTAGLIAQQARAECERLERLAQSTRDRDRTNNELERAIAALAEHQRNLDAARNLEGGTASAVTLARQGLEHAEAARDAALAAREAQQQQRLLSAAFDRLDQAIPLTARVEELRSRVEGSQFTTESLAHLDELERAVEQAKAVAEAGAATLRIQLDPQTQDARLNGDPLVRSGTLSVTSAILLELPGVVTIEIDPPSSGADAAARWRDAMCKRDQMLSQLGSPSLADARQRAQVRAEDAQTLAALTAQITAICVADPALEIGSGFDALKAALLNVARPPTRAPADRSDVDEPLREAAFIDLRAEERRAQAAWDEAREASQALEVAHVGMSSEVDSMTRELDRLAQELDQQVLPDQDLEVAIGDARKSEASATLSLAAARRATESLSEIALRQEKEEWIRREKNQQADRIGLLQEIARLEVEAKTRGGDGPANRALETREKHEQAKALLDNLSEEAATLQLLKTTIIEAQNDAARRYLAPIKNRVQPYVSRLLPATDLGFGEDYRPSVLVRGGREEPADALSKGTQEQLAVLTRVAFADLLWESGKPASLVLDDALVFADDDRFETMTEILREAAERMQVIILSCRASAYQGLEAKRIMLG
jgi:hypothetical protein